jgi:hypothetical protein
MLVRPGADGRFDTTACGWPGGDDETVFFASVRYETASPAAPRSTAVLTPERPLDDGLYRLLACGHLEDRVGSQLAGGDHALGFRVDDGNLLRNGHFDCGLEDWQVEPPDAHQALHSQVDGDGSAESGSLQVSSGGVTELALGQCVPVLPASPAPLVLGGRTRLDAAPEIAIESVASCRFFAQTHCSGAVVAERSSVEAVTGTGSLFADGEVAFEPVPGARSAVCRFELLSPGAETFDAYLDGLFLRIPSIFSDGFESGDTTAWSSATN